MPNLDALDQTLLLSDEPVTKQERNLWQSASAIKVQHFVALLSGSLPKDTPARSELHGSQLAQPGAFEFNCTSS